MTVDGITFFIYRHFLYTLLKDFKMKAILEFNLPDDKTEFDTASKAMDWAILAWDIEQYIRNRLKYQTEKLDVSSAHEELEILRKELHDLMEESGLQFLP